MKNFGRLGLALAFVAAITPTMAMADDPHDPAMRTERARARDRAIIKRLNEQQLAYVRQRDAGKAQRYQQAQRDQEAYADARADYERDMRAWRRAVDNCYAGQWEYCDR